MTFWYVCTFEYRPVHVVLEIKIGISMMRKIGGPRDIQNIKQNNSKWVESFFLFVQWIYVFTKHVPIYEKMEIKKLILENSDG